MQTIARRHRQILRRRGLFPLRAVLCCALALACASAAEPEGEGRAEPAAQASRLARPARATGAPVVILLSLDGIRYDALAADELPAFARIIRDGASAQRFLPVFPSLTFPTHVSLATGAYPETHGIVANQFWDPARATANGSGEEYDYSGDASWLDAEPIWVAAERQGIPAAVFFWVGSETDWHGIGATHREAPFDASVSEAEKVDQILAWLDLPQNDPSRPGLILEYWRGADRAGHRYGPNSDAVREALREQDLQLGRLLEGLDAREAWPDTTLIVLSDHGMVEAGDAVNVAEIVRDAGILARTIHAGALAHIHLEDIADESRTIALLEATPGVRAYAARDLPADLRYAHPSRSGDVIALATPPYVFSSASQSLGARMLRAAGSRPGMHGYDVREVPEMASIFLAAGRGVEAARSLGDVRAIDVAATVAALLGIDPPANSEGEPIDLGALEAER